MRVIVINAYEGTLAGQDSYKFFKKIISNVFFLLFFKYFRLLKIPKSNMLLKIARLYL